MLFLSSWDPRQSSDQRGVQILRVTLERSSTVSVDCVHFLQCWSRKDRDTDCHERSSVPSLQRETGGHTKDHCQHEETENEDGPDSCA